MEVAGAVSATAQVIHPLSRPSSRPTSSHSGLKATPDNAMAQAEVAAQTASAPLSRKRSRSAVADTDVSGRFAAPSDADVKILETNSPSRTEGAESTPGVSSSRRQATKPTATATSRDTSSELANVIDAEDASMTAGTGPSPYGTRSRNRAGASRVNYAEDRDNDMEFEFASKKTPSKAASASEKPQATDMVKTTSSHAGRKASKEKEKEAATAASASTAPSTSGKSAAASGSASAAATEVGAGVGSKETNSNIIIPGTSSFSVADSATTQVSGAASGTGTISKKRKAAQVSGANDKNDKSAGGTSASNGPPSKRRANTMVGAAAASAAKDSCSNTITFERSGSSLNKHGALPADDGEIYRVNGR